MSIKTLDLHIYNIKVRIASSSEYVFENLEKDFVFYMNKNGTDNLCKEIKINIHKGNPLYHKVPPLAASLYSLGSICYRSKGVHYVDYSGKGLLIYNFRKEEGNLYSKDEGLLYEKSRLVILSRIGELLDNRHIHRVHAVGFTKDKKATVCLLPMEGGKTTLAMNVLKKDNKIKLISDDVCFMDIGCYVYPFTLRIGARDQNLISDIPEKYITKIGRNFYGEKYLIDVTYFRHRIAEKCKICNILIGKRIFQEETEIRRISKIRCLVPFIQSGVFGLGLPQIVELFLRGSFLDIVKKINMIFSRSILFLSIVSQSKTYEIKIGRDLEKTDDVLINFINEKLLKI